MTDFQANARYQFAKLCTISVVLAFLCCFFGNPVSCYKIAAFKDFLAINNLKYGIIILQGNQSINREPGLRNLLENYRIRFYNTNNMQHKLDDFFYYSSPRVGILLPKFENTNAIQSRVFTEASQADTFNNSYAWFAIAEEDDNSLWTVEEIENILKPHFIKINSDFTVAVKSANSSSSGNIFLKLYDIYRICNPCDFPLEIVEKGNWTKEQGMIWPLKFYEGFGARRRNLKNYSLSTGSALSKVPKGMTPIDFLVDNEVDKHIDSLPRKGYQIFKMAASVLNVTYNITIYDSWGLKAGDNWTGLVGGIVRHEQELTLSPMRFTLPRLKVLQYTPVIHTETILFLLRHPRQNAIRNIFFSPLADDVWWSILALIVLATVLLAMFLKQERNKRNRDIASKNAKEQNITSTPVPESRFDFVLLVILEAFLMQGPSPDIFKFVSTRTLVMSTCIFTIMLMQFYGAFIVGSLLTPPTRTITNRAALFNSSFKLGLENISFNIDVFINTKDPIAQKMYKKMQMDPKNSIMTIDEGAQRIKRGGFAFHMSIDRMYRILIDLLTESEFCDLQEIPLEDPFPCAAIHSTNFAYRDLFAVTIGKLRELGLINHNNKRWEVRKIDCSLNMNKVVGVDLEHFIPALAVLALAVLVSGIVLILEILYKRERMRNGPFSRLVGRIENFGGIFERT